MKHGGGLMLLIGWSRFAAAVLLLFIIPTTFVFHAFWSVYPEAVQDQGYHAQPVQRVYIPKPDGRERPIGILTLEDKIVQRATVAQIHRYLAVARSSTQSHDPPRG